MANPELSRLALVSDTLSSFRIFSLLSCSVPLLLRSSAFQHSLFETQRNLETQRKRGAEKDLGRVGPRKRKELKLFGTRALRLSARALRLNQQPRVELRPISNRGDPNFERGAKTKPGELCRMQFPHPRIGAARTIFD